MTQVTDFLNYQYSKQSPHTYYSIGSGRCDPDRSGYDDCSGLQCAAMHHVGLATPQFCMNSFSLSAWCHQHGTGMSIAQARVTPGAWVFVGQNEGESGSHGHIAVSTGDGRVFAARGHFIWPQVGFSPFYVDPWSYAAWPPGLQARGVPLGLPNPGPSHPAEGKAMGLAAAKIVPGSHQQQSVRAQQAGWLNHYPFVGAQQNPDGTWSLVGFNGAEILNKGAVPAFGMSVLNLGHLNQPIDAGDVVGKTIVFLAGDGGTFIPNVKVHYI